VVHAFTQADGRICFEVSDRGIGVPAQQLERIFERFFRVDAEAVRRRRGTGLGLYVVSSLVREMGGKVEAHSEGPGMGTAVRVFLPPGLESLAIPAPAFP